VKRESSEQMKCHEEKGMKWKWKEKKRKEIVPNTEHEMTNSYVLISSHRRGYEQGAADESENKLGTSFPIMTTKLDVTHLLHALMMKRNGRSNGNKWAMQFRAPIDNVLAVEHKYRNSLSIKVRNRYKRKEQ